MAHDARHVQRSHDQEREAHTWRAEFREAPGEAEADASRDAFLQRASTSPGELGAALAGADDALRAQVVGRLQRERGNSFVQRVVAGSRGVPGQASAVQREGEDDEQKKQNPDEEEGEAG